MLLRWRDYVLDSHLQLFIDTQRDEQDRPGLRGEDANGPLRQAIHTTPL